MIEVKVRPSFNVCLPNPDPKKGNKTIYEGETALLTEREYEMVAHQVEIVQPPVKPTAKGVNNP